MIKVLLGLLVILSLGYVATTAAPIISTAKAAPTPIHWYPTVGYQHTQDSTSFHSILGKDGNIVVGQILIVYSVPKLVDKKSYKSKVIGIAIDCESASFRFLYDLYFTQDKPNVSDDSVAGVKYSISGTEGIRKIQKESLLIRTFCGSEV